MRGCITSMGQIILITGGQRSGKSRHAELLALRLSSTPVYMATATVSDEEMERRVALHQARRGDRWTTIEERLYLSRHDIYNKVVVVDCVTLWCTNYMMLLPGADVATLYREITAEFDRFTSQEAIFIFVSNEIGSGGISANAMQRAFTDLQGMVNQYIASRADEVILMVSGIAMTLKGQGCARSAVEKESYSHGE